MDIDIGPVLQGSLESSGETEVFAEVQTITTTALDSINGWDKWNKQLNWYKIWECNLQTRRATPT